MKRSEALTLIREKLYGVKMQEDFAEQILSVVEEIGMEPPKYTSNPNTWYRSTGDYGYEINEWEKE